MRCGRSDPSSISAVKAIQGAPVRADQQAAGGDGGGAEDLGVEPQLLELSSFFEIQHVKVPIQGADIHALAGDDGGAIDVAVGGEAPDGLAGLAVDGVKEAVLAADENE